MTLSPTEAATMFTEGFRSGVKACMRDIEAAADRLSKSGEVMPAATLASMRIALQRHLPKGEG